MEQKLSQAAERLPAMEMNFETIADICYKERDEGSKLISVSIVVKDGNSGDNNGGNQQGGGSQDTGGGLEP
jgi:hypothetical protein